MKWIATALCLMMMSWAGMAQKNGKVSGLAFDTLAGQPVASATVTLMKKADSSLVSFTMTGNDGRFELKGLANGDYRLLITHTGYHNSNHYFSLTDSNQVAGLGRLLLNDKNKILSEVVVTSEAPPITLINDTVQYNAGSFKVQPNANVEQLLRKLPGVKVERDGTIRAQGEKVSRVLVDGKEFFGNDPKVATKNLPADAVDKVQVYDRQSDQAQLTGFEDGNHEKTINLKLKKEKKKGLFGKVNAGAGTRERFEGRFNVNAFKGARQFSAIGMGNNTNAEGFSIMDILNFSGELARMQRGGGGNINLNMSGDEAAAMGLGQGGRNNGINTAWSGGLNYNNIIGTRLDLQSSYFHTRFNPRTESQINRQSFLPGSVFNYNQNSSGNNQNNNHRFNLNALFQIDSSSTIRFNPSFNYQQTGNRSNTDYSTGSAEGRPVNDGRSDNTGFNQGYNFRNEMSWRKKLVRRGRTFSLSLQTSLNKSDGGGSLSAINNFYQPNGLLLKKDTLNQTHTTSGSLEGYTARAVYTEPVLKRSLLEFSIGRGNTRNSSEKITSDYNRLSGKFDLLNPALSNNFENTYGLTSAGIRLRTQKKKYSYALGLTWQQAELQGRIISNAKDSVIGKTFKNLLPNARFQYNFSRFRTASITYSASTSQPGITQLQPVPDNSNALNIREGNPDLKQEYTHNLQAHLTFLNPFRNKNFFAFINVQATQNKIVNADLVDQLGVKRTRPVNVNGVYNIMSDLSYSRPLAFIPGTVEIGVNTGLFRTRQFINGAANNIRTFSSGPSLRLDISPAEKLNLGLGTALSFNSTTYSLNEGLNARFSSQEYSASVDWEMPKRFFFSTDFTYTANSQRAAGFNTRVPIWNAAISKQMLRFNRGELKFAVQDLLNKNIGISRNTNNNYIEDVRNLTLRRFFLLSFTYSLNKTGLNNAGGGGGMRIITR